MVDLSSERVGTLVDLKLATVNSATTDFFMGMWVKFETYSENEQFGIDLFDGYVYFETRANGSKLVLGTVGEVESR